MFSKKNNKPVLKDSNDIVYTETALNFYNYGTAVVFDRNVILTFKQVTPNGTVKQQKLVMSGIVAKGISEMLIEPLKDYKKFEGEFEYYDAAFYQSNDKDHNNLNETLLYIHDLEIAFSPIAFLLQFEQDTDDDGVYKESYIVNPEFAAYIKKIIDDAVREFESKFGEIILD